MCSPHMHIKYLMIIICSFEMAVILVFFCPASVGSHRDFISHVLQYLFFTYIHKRNNATVTYFLKFVSIYFKIHILFTSLRHHVL